MLRSFKGTHSAAHFERRVDDRNTFSEIRIVREQIGALLTAGNENFHVRVAAGLPQPAEVIVVVGRCTVMFSNQRANLQSVRNTPL